MQINYQQSPASFGMSVKASPRAREIMQKKSTGYLNKFKQIETKFKNSEFINIYIRDDLTPVLNLKGTNIYYSDMNINSFPINSVVTARVKQEKNPFGHTKAKELVRKFRLESPEIAAQLYKSLKSVKNYNKGLTKMDIIAETFENSAVTRPII